MFAQALPRLLLVEVHYIPNGVLYPIESALVSPMLAASYPYGADRAWVGIALRLIGNGKLIIFSLLSRHHDCLKHLRVVLERLCQLHILRRHLLASA